MTAAKLKVILLDAKKACGCAVTMAAAAVSADLISGHVAALITGVAGVVSTGVVFLLENKEV